VRRLLTEGSTYSRTQLLGTILQYARFADMLSYSGHTVKIQFRARTDQNYPATFFIDDVSLAVTR
jgi:hypothetical protein